MITYGFSVQGKSHKKRSTVCQDYNKIETLISGWHLGVVADGVGSAPHADIGSRIAVEALCSYCKKGIDAKMSDGQLEDMLRQGYTYALEQVNQYALEHNDDSANYDTTLSAALYNGKKVIYGHAGDGGILVRFCNGETKPITKRQKGADGSSVIPLRNGEISWDFGICEERIAAVLLATDGMLDGVFQPALLNLPSNRMALARGSFSQDHAYITATEFFMNPDGVYLNKKISRPDDFMEKYMTGNLDGDDQKPFLLCIQHAYTKFLGKEKAGELGRRISKDYYAVWALKNVTDDKSVVCMMNEKAEVSPQDVSYYYEPDWKYKQEQYEALLYGKAMPVKPPDDREGDVGITGFVPPVRQNGKEVPVIVKRGVICVLALVLLVGGVKIVLGIMNKSGGGQEVADVSKKTSESKRSSNSPKPSNSPEPSNSPKPSKSSESSNSPKPSDFSEPIKSPEPSIQKAAQNITNILAGKDVDGLSSNNDIKKFVNAVKEQYGELSGKEKKTFKDILKKISDEVASDVVSSTVTPSPATASGIRQ